MKNIFIDDTYAHFYYLDKSKYNIINSKENFMIDSLQKDNENDIYIKTRRSSWFSAKDNVIDMTRIHDLDMLKNIKDFGISVPDYLYCNNSRHYFRNMANFEYIIKSYDSARSLGQMFVNNENVNEIISDSCSLNYKEFNEKYKIDISTCNNKEEEKCLIESIKESNYYLSRKIDFEKEYRVLYFKGCDVEDFIIEDREGYQINSTEKRTHNVINIEDSKYKFELTPIIGKLKEFGDSLPHPMISFDVYTTNNDWGLFEYSTEFGCDYTGNNCRLKHMINASIDYVIREEI